MKSRSQDGRTSRGASGPGNARNWAPPTSPVNNKWPGWRPNPPPASLAPPIPGAPAPLPPVAALPPVQPLPLPPPTVTREMPKRRTWPIRFEHGERQRGS